MRNFAFTRVSLVLSVLLFAAGAQAQESAPLPGSHAPAFNRITRPPKYPGSRQPTQEAAVADAASGYSYSALYNFCPVAHNGVCTDGQGPEAGLIQDAEGNLYGTTSGGGNSPNGGGTVFMVDPTGHETVLYNFCPVVNRALICTDGTAPEGGLVRDAAGNLYGTASGGGSGLYTQSNMYDAGTVFKVDSTGHFSVLYNFCSLANCTDGSNPQAGLIQDAAGNLYGTTTLGGTGGSGGEGAGAVFKVDSTGHETVLYSFCSSTNCADGQFPHAGLVQDSAGNLYGTTLDGGANGRGTVFKVDGTGHETVLYSFCSTGTTAVCTDGSYPFAGLIRDTAGNLYGATSGGGANAGTNYGDDYGVVFKVDSAGHETVLYSFCPAVNSAGVCLDGNFPQAGLVQDAAGSLYGTAGDGGANAGLGSGAGVVFKVDPTGIETVLYSFCSVGGQSCTDGEDPHEDLILDAAGNLYGAMDNGGNNNGVVFKLTAPILTPQTIAFPNPGPLTYGVGSISLIASATSGLPVSFAAIAASPANVGTVSGDTLTITNAGSVTVQATQFGNGTYAAAPPVSDVIVVNKASLSVLCNNASLDYGWPIPTLASTLSGVVPGDAITATCSTLAVEGSPAGPYPIAPTLHDPNGRLPNYSVTSTNGTLTIGAVSTSAPLPLSLSPSSAAAGSASFPLTVNGVDFNANSVVLWNGAVRATVFVSSTQLTATILTADIAAEGTGLVTVANSAPNAATSAALPFAVMSATPVAKITGASISDAADGSGNHLLTLSGADFVSSSTVDWNGASLVTSQVSPWQILAVVPAADYAALSATLTVVNSSGTSAGFTLP